MTLNGSVFVRRRVRRLLVSALLLPGAAAAAESSAAQVSPIAQVDPRQVTLTAGGPSVSVRLTVYPAVDDGVERQVIIGGLPGGVTATPAPQWRYIPPDLYERYYTLAAAGSSRPGTHLVTFTDRGTGAVARLRLTVERRDPGDLQLTLRDATLQLCDGGPPAGSAATITPIRGYQGTPRLARGPLPSGITVTPERLSTQPLPPTRTIPFQLQARGSGAGRFRVELRATDPAHEIERTTVLTLDVETPEFTPTADPTPLRLRQGAPAATLRLGASGNRCFTGRRIDVTLEGAPQGLVLGSTQASATAPAFATTVSVRVLPALAVGTYALTARFVSGDGLARTLRIPVNVLPPGAGELLRTPRIDRVTPAEVTPGGEHRLRLEGRNLRVGQSISFGGDIQVIGEPIVHSPMSATVTVRVLPGATPGARAARVASDVGSSEGPGAVLVRGVPRRGRAPEPPMEPRRGTPPADEPAPIPPRSIAPRVDRAHPSELLPGLTYTLLLEGKSFSREMQIDFGAGVALDAALVVESPWRAAAKVRVADDAAAGTRRVTAWDERGRSEGPAELDVRGSDDTRLPPEFPWLATPAITIELVNPRAPNAPGCSGGGCRPPVLVGGTVFTWRESNPGVSETFLLEILDAGGKVLASAQSTDPLYRVTPAFLAALPRLGDPGSWTGQPAFTAALQGVQSIALPPDGGAGVASLDVLPMQLLAFHTGWQQLPGVVWWRVTGFRGNAETGDTEEVGRSEERGLLLPLPPTGLDNCSAAPAGSKVQITKRVPAPGSHLTDICAGPGLNPLCADSIVTIGGVLDVSRSPYLLGMIGAPMPPHPQLGPAVMFRNLFIDYGDGSAPEPLQLHAAAAMNPEKIVLVGPMGAGLRHHYRTPGTYTARIFALGNPEQGLAQIAAAQRPQLLQFAQSDYDFTPGMAGATRASPATGDAQSPTKPEAAFLVSCTPVTMVPDPEAGREGPLDLLSADIEWSPPYTGQDPAHIVECSESFRPRVRIVYSGTGKVRLTWHRTDSPQPWPIEVSSPPTVLPGVSFVEAEAGNHPAYFDLEASLPLFVRDKPYRLEVTVEDASIPPTGPVGPTFAVPMGQGQTPLGEVGLSVDSGSQNPFGDLPPLLLQIAPMRRTKVVSPVREYYVVPVPEGQPCRLRYETSESGTLFITDLALEGQGFGDPGSSEPVSVSGTGTLGVRFPDGAGGVGPRHVPVSFDQWQVERGETGGDWLVLSGQLAASPSIALPVAGFTLGVDSLALSPQRLAIDGRLEVGSSQGLLHPQGGWNRVTFPFKNAAIEPPGGFHQMLSGLSVKAKIGSSGFNIVFHDVTIDLSLTKGMSLPPTPPAGIAPGHPLFYDWQLDMACAPQPFGPAFIGVAATKARLEVPAFQFTDVDISVPAFDIGKWSVGPGGSSARIVRQIGHSAKIGPVAAHFNQLDLRACHGSTSARLRAQLQDLPIVEKLTFTVRFDQGGGVVAEPGKLSVKRDYGVVGFDVQQALFGRADDLGTWAVELDGSLRLQLNPQLPVFTRSIDGLRVGLDGRIYSPVGLGDWFPVNAGTGSLAGFGINVTEMGIGWQAGQVWFGLSAGLELSDVIELQATRLKFRIAPQGASYKSAGVEFDEIAFSSQFPAGNPLAQLSGSVGWASSGGAYRFHGNGSLRVVNSLGLDVGVLFGRQQGKSYWLARAATTLPVPIPLGSTPLLLQSLQGGLGYGVSVDSYTKPLSQVTPKIGAGVSVMAGIGIAYATDYLLFMEGSLAMQFSGPGAGFRVDAEAWVLDKNLPPKPKPAPLHTCVRLSGGQFTVAAGADLSILAGAFRVQAPSGPDPCTSSNAAISLSFGPQSQWHMYFGRKTNKVSVRAFARQASGYLELAPGGFAVGANVNRQFGPYKVGTKCWNLHCEGGFDWGADFALQLQPTLHIYGSANAQAHVAIGGCLACKCGSLGFGIGAQVSAQAPSPTKVCLDRLWVKSVPVLGDVTIVRDRCLG